MLRTPRDFEYNKIEAELNNIEYKIDINDQLTFQLYTNNGFQLIDRFSSNVSNLNTQSQSQRMMNNLRTGIGSLYLIRQDSLVEFPIIGDVNLVGKTIK